MSPVNISEMIEACLQDRQLCRVAGIAEIDPNLEAASHVIALVARLRDRHGVRAATKAAFTLWDSLAPGAPESVQLVAGMLAPVVGLKIGSFLLRSTPPQLLSAALKGGATRAELEAATNMMQRPNPATFAEALNKVTDGKFPQLLAYQRVAERTQGGQAVLGPFMSQRLGQNIQEVRNVVGPLPEGQAAEAVPSQVQAGAQAVVQGARNETNAMSQAAYDATTGNPAAKLSGKAFGQLLTEQPGISDAIKTVRNNPLQYGNLEGLPDNSLAVLDATKKYLDDAASEAQRRGANYATKNTAGAASAIRDAIVAENPRYASALNIQSSRQMHVEEPLQRGVVGQVAEGAATVPNMRNLLGLTSRTETPLPLSPTQVGLAVKSIAEKQPQATPQLLGQIMQDDLQNTIAKTRPGFANQQAATSWRYRLFGSADSTPERRWHEAIANATPDGETRWKGFRTLLDVLDAQGYRLPAGSNTASDTQAIQQLGQSRLPLTPSQLNPLSSQGRLAQWWEDFTLGKNSGQMAKLLTDQKNAGYWAALAKTDPKSPAAWNLVNALIGSSTAAEEPAR